MKKLMFFGGVIISVVSSFLIWLHFVGYMYVPEWFFYNVYFKNFYLFQRFAYVSIGSFTIGLMMIYYSFQNLTKEIEEWRKEDILNV